MSTLEEINQQIAFINGGKPAGFQSLIKYLPGILNPGEEIEALVEGSFNDDLMVLVSTADRLIFLTSNTHGANLQTASLAYTEITSVQHRQQKKFWAGYVGSVRITGSGTEITVDSIYNYNARDFAGQVLARVENCSEKPGTAK